MEITFLGTSCMVPTKERNHSGTLVTYRKDGILVDCGEGTQRQFKMAGIPITKVTKILISHWHGDHVLGLPGLIQTLSASGYDKTLEIYGPKGTKTLMEHMFKAFVFDQKIELKITEISNKKIFENERFYIEALPLDHGMPSFGFSIIEKDWRKVDMAKVKKLGLKAGPMIGKLVDGKTVTEKGKKIKPNDVSKVVPGRKISFITDTLLCKNCYELSKNADVLVSEASYTEEHEEKAREYYHMTAKQAALVASKNNVKKLVLTHFSTRYKTTKALQEEAADVFPDTTCAFDLMKIKV